MAVTAIYLTSAYRVLSRSAVEWKGRTYVVDESKSVVPPPHNQPAVSAVLSADAVE